MPKRKYKSNPNELLAEGRILVKSTKDAEYRHRVEMVNLVLAGMVPSELSKYCGESKNTITGWVKIADEQGFDALKPKEHPGRPKRLAPEQVAELKKLIGKDDPKGAGYPVWDGPNLSNYISKTYEVDLSVRQCQRLLREMGFTLLRAQPCPAKNPTASKVELFKKN